jgi:hypothetical protein
VRAGRFRHVALKATVSVASTAFLTVNFGLIDLADGFFGYVDDARNQVLDAGWGAVFGIVVPVGLLAQLRRPERRIAGVQQVVLAAVALAVAAAAGAAWGYFVLAGVLALVCGVVLAAHPSRELFVRPGVRSHPLLALAGAAVVVPALVYAERMTSASRRHLPPADAETNGLAHWPVMGALALLVVALPFLAATGTRGWRIPYGSAMLAALAWGVSCALAPAAAGSEGAGWAWAAIGWSVAAGCLGFVEHLRERRYLQHR